LLLCFSLVSITAPVCAGVRGVAGEPANIKCTLTGNSKVKLGQKVDGDIDVSVRDKHGNEINKVTRVSAAVTHNNASG